MSKDCGSDECGDWGDNYCKDGDVYHKTICVKRGCSESECYERTEPDEERVEDCEFDCADGRCLIYPVCWIDDMCPECYYCSWGRCKSIPGTTKTSLCGKSIPSGNCSQQEGGYSGCIGNQACLGGFIECSRRLFLSYCRVWEPDWEDCGPKTCTDGEYHCDGTKLYYKTWCSGGCFRDTGHCQDFGLPSEVYLRDCGPITSKTGPSYCDYKYGRWWECQKTVYSGGCIEGVGCQKENAIINCVACPYGCSEGKCREKPILPDCGHTCLNHGTASVGWPDCSCTRRSPASGYKIIGTWNSSDCPNCTGYKKTLPDCGHTCVNHGTTSHVWPDCSCTRRSPASGYEIIGTWNSSDCPNCTGYRKIGCSCTSWANGSCGGGSCSATQRQQTRTCTPSGCDSQSRCVADSACLVPILNLFANPSSIDKGQSSTLSWSSSNTSSCSWTAGLSGSVPTSGSRPVSPSITTSYSMKCTGPGGSISRSTTVTIITVIPNQPPSATNLKVVQPDYCLSGPAAYFSWTFTDPDPGDTQSAYRVQVDNNSNFSKPEDDSGKVTSSSNSYATILGKLKYNNTYYWRLKVWDNKGLDSNWISGPSFSTPTHACPEIDFSWSPFKPSVNEDVLFVDQSTVYGGTTKESWFWTFQDGSPASSTEQNPTAKFPSTGEKDITLRVTDSDGFSCSRTKTLNSQLPLPIWKEIAPF
ncbi:MAG: PKD domain-containing protein [Candidatus Nealsonbacteria bacterium]